MEYCSTVFNTDDDVDTFVTLLFLFADDSKQNGKKDSFGVQDGRGRGGGRSYFND